MLSGGCFCGEVRYEASGQPMQRSICHCSMCRRTTGAPCVAWFTVDQGSFRYTRGTPARFQSSPDAVRSFCAHCGAQLTFEDRRCAGEIDITSSSLDDPELAPPQKHIFVSTQLSWVKLADGLPRFLHSSADGEPV